MKKNILIRFFFFLLLGSIFIGISFYEVNKQNFTAQIYVTEDVIYEGEIIYITVLIKNISPYTDSIKNLSEFTITKYLNIKNSQNISSGVIEESLGEHYEIFEPYEEKKYQINLNICCNFSGLTPFFGYYPAEQYKSRLSFPLSDSVYLKSNQITFEVLKNTARNEVLYNKIRSLDSLIYRKINSSEYKNYIVEIINSMDSLLNDYIDLRMIESVITTNNIVRLSSSDSVNTNFISNNINYIKQNPTLRNINQILGHCLIFIEHRNRARKNEEMLKLKDYINHSLYENYELKNQLINTIDSLIYLRSKDDKK